jgi:hypothetical protein
MIRRVRKKITEHAARQRSVPQVVREVANLDRDVANLDEEVANLDGEVPRVEREVRQLGGELAKVGSPVGNPGRGVAKVDEEVAQPGGNVARLDAGLANGDDGVAQVQPDLKSLDGAVDHRPAEGRDSGRSRLRHHAAAAGAGEALAQVVVHVLRAVTAAVGRLAHALVVRQVGHPHFAGYQLQSVNHLRKLGERLDTDGAFAVERLRYV